MSRLSERSSTATASTASLPLPLAIPLPMVQRSVSLSRCASPAAEDTCTLDTETKLEPATPRASPAHSALYPYEYSALPLPLPLPLPQPAIAMAYTSPANAGAHEHRLGFELHRADVHVAPPLASASGLDSWDINENDLVSHLSFFTDSSLLSFSFSFCSSIVWTRVYCSLYCDADRKWNRCG